MLFEFLPDAQISETRWMPYPGICDQHGDAYARLVGLNLLQDFRRALRERVGGVLACTHITELAQVLPTAVVQAFAGEVIDTRGSAPGAGKPFQIDRCHALRSDGDAVRLLYPRWYRAAATSPASGERAVATSDEGVVATTARAVVQPTNAPLRAD